MATPFLDIVKAHIGELRPGDWQHDQHREAWFGPTYREKGIRNMIVGYAQMCDAYCDGDTSETQLGSDGYFHEHARDMILAMLAALNLDVTGRLDCGTLDRLIRRLAAASEVELPE